jgi:hypothetical protein
MKEELDQVYKPWWNTFCIAFPFFFPLLEPWGYKSWKLEVKVRGVSEKSDVTNGPLRLPSANDPWRINMKLS